MVYGAEYAFKRLMYYNTIHPRALSSSKLREHPVVIVIVIALLREKEIFMDYY